MFRLTESDFKAQQIRLLCQEFSEFDSACSDADLWNFELLGASEEAENFRLQVSLYSNHEVSCAVLPVCFWEKSQDNEKNEQKEFDAAYDEFFERAVSLLGKPFLRGRDVKGNKHQYTIWRGKNGLFILQQSANDPQFGMDVNFWVQPWNSPDIPLQDCFIDWLHAQCMFPPLFVMPGGWQTCQLGAFDKELASELELNLKHPLRNVKALSIARDGRRDEFLFQLQGYKAPLAMVHLTWAKETRPDWPSFELFQSFEEWREYLKVPRNWTE